METKDTETFAQATLIKFGKQKYEQNENLSSMDLAWSVM